MSDHQPGRDRHGRSSSQAASVYRIVHPFLVALFTLKALSWSCLDVYGGRFWPAPDALQIGLRATIGAPWKPNHAYKRHGLNKHERLDG